MSFGRKRFWFGTCLAAFERSIEMDKSIYWNCSKRTKNFASGAYSSLSNQETPIEDAEVDTPSPMGWKIAKRKIKGKGVGTSTNPLDLTGVEEAIREKMFSTPN